jgi:membrane associated rhomboid family serine protease
MEAPEVRITGTLLSAKPREESAGVSLLIGLVIAFTSMLCWRVPQLAGLLSASRLQVVAQRELWRLLTTIAVHTDLLHLAANVPLVIFFGYLLYGYFGFWVYPAAILPLASVATLLSLLTYPPEVVLIGASGLVYLMLGFWLVLYAFIERTLPVKKRLLRAAGIALIVLVPTTVQPGVSYRTHFIACGLGMVAAMPYFLAKKEKIRSAETVEMEPPPEPPEP